MRRRTLLAATAAATAGAAGCAGILENGTSEDDRGPAETVATFYRTLARGNREGANELVHPDSPVGEVGQEIVNEFEGTDLRVEQTEVLSRDGDTAEARIEMSLSPPEEDGRVSGDLRFELRREDGEWLLWEDLDAGPDRRAGPQVSWDLAEVADGETVTAVEFTHDGGDTVDTGQLSARAGGERATSSRTDEALSAGSMVTVPLDGDGDSLSAETTVELMWTPEDGEPSLLGEHRLARPSAGSLGDAIEFSYTT